MDPVTALRQIAYYKDRNRHDPRRVMAYRNAADIIEGLDDAARQRHGQANSWQSLAGIGPKTAKVIAQAWSGREPDLLAELRADAEDLGGGAIRAALRGDLHLHSNWSDGSAPIEEMMATAAALGHQYCALTDHSPRLTIANGLSPDRLRKQLDVIDELREKFAPLRILTGIEVDILEDGSLDQEPEMLDRLDIVVASVHSKLSMDSAAMTRRMVRAVANGHTDVLGHCTGRLIAGNRGIRPESKFDAEAVFTACREHGTAVEINSRPERRDPPTRLLHLARDIGCVFSIDTDAHAPGQLDFLGYGAQRALDAEVPAPAPNGPQCSHGNRRHGPYDEWPRRDVVRVGGGDCGCGRSGGQLRGVRKRRRWVRDGGQHQGGQQEADARGQCSALPADPPMHARRM
ncbi:hydrolase [Mycobacterium tuberculosis]|nr:hydrolase [Mycobacterium tuberculosis]SGZ67675.1 hydrolase [Mycobacterium tuberculosis]